MAKQRAEGRPAAFRFFLILAFSIVVVETGILLSFHLFLPRQVTPLLEVFSETVLLIIFLTPVLYLFSYRPFLREMSERVQIAESLRGFQTGYSSMIRTSMDGFWITDMQGRFLDVNDSYCRLIGYSREALLTMSVKDVEALETQHDTQRHIKKIIERGSDRFETRHRCQNGRVVDIEASVNYLNTDGGRFFVFLRDITEKKAKEAQLQHLIAFNQTVMQTIPYGMDIVDSEGTILYLGPKLEALFGKEAVGRKCWSLYRDDKSQCQDCPLKQEIVLGRTSDSETSGALGGRMLQISHTGMEYQGKRAILEIFQDITVRKHYEEDLVKANKELLKIDRLKDEFLTTVSHELRTPLSMVKEGISQVNEGLHGELKEKQKYFLGKVQDNVNRLAQIVNSIIEITKFEAGEIELTREAVDVKEVAREVIATLALQAQNKHLEIKTNFPDQKIGIVTDKKRLYQVFTNLIENAIKYTEKGQIEIQIFDKGKEIECSVVDTGRGFSDEDLTKVFDKFEQFDKSYGPGARGLGLGLPIDKGIIELQRGKLWAESTIGKGSRFTFTLPKGIIGGNRDVASGL